MTYTCAILQDYQLDNKGERENKHAFLANVTVSNSSYPKQVSLIELEPSVMNSLLFGDDSHC